MKKIAVLFCTCILITGCTSNPKVDIQAEADKIRGIEDQWTTALQNKDANKVMSIYSAEGVVMKPNNATYVGLESIRNQVESDFADTSMLWNTVSTTIDLVEVSTSGDLAYARGINRGQMKTQAGLVENADKWIDIYKKIDGQWKCSVSIWNTNQREEEISSSDAALELFTRLENEWNNAVVKKDKKVLDLIYAKEYTFVDPTGKVFDKQQDISEITSENYKSEAPSVLSEIKVNLYGNFAVVKGLNTSKATLNGKDISGTYRFVDVFVMRDGRWQCVSTQSSKLPKK